MAESEAVDVRQAHAENGRSIYALITANDLDGIHSMLNPLTLRHRQSIVCQTVSNKTLLRYACELGLRDIVKYLLDECEADISERCTNCQICSSPLRVSTSNLDVSMIILLISRGVVTVDEREARTCTTSAFDKNCFLLESILNRYIYEIKPVEILDFLTILSLKIDIDLTDDSNHILGASARGDIDRMKSLLAYSINTKGTNIFEDNALCMTIMNEEKNAEHFLMNYRVFSPKDHVRALELCGAKLITFKFDFEKGLRCWRRSLRIRNEYFLCVSDNCQNRFKTNLGFQFRCEEQLDTLADHVDELYIQALIVFVRLLSPNSEILQNAFVLVAQQRVFRKDLMRAIKVLAELSELPYEPGSGYIYPMQRALEIVVPLLQSHFHSDSSDKGELRCEFRSLLNFTNEVDWRMLFNGPNQFHGVVYIQLLMLVLWKIIAMKNFDLCANDEVWIKDGVTKILQYHSGPYPTTLLHLAIEDPTAYSVIPFLISCSADANCIDNEKNTPLHIVSLLRIDNDSRLRLVNLLTAAGGHIDSVNNIGTTPFMAMKVNGHIQNPLKFLSLQCLAAQTIYKHDIKVPDVYPKILASFIKLHSE